MLVVSRPDISCDEIVDYPASTRFIKLPIANYLKLVGAWDELNRPQMALINALNSPNYRFICAALSRRLGKTYIANIVGQLVTLVPGSNVLIISPNYNLSSISFELQRKFIKHFDLEIARDNLKDRVIELENGSTIRMGSVSTVDSTVGRSYDLIIFDEAALSSQGEDAFNVALRPTLDKLASKAIFISTPRGKNNWFSKFFDRGFSEDFSQWCSIHADYLENPRMTDADVLEARRAMSKAEFEQEYMASFNTFEGQIFDSSSVVIAEYSPVDGESFAGCDPGYRDATAWATIRYCYESDCYWIVDEYLESQASTSEHAKHFQTQIDRWGVELCFIDSAAAQFAADLAYEYDIPTQRAKKDVLPGIAYVQTLIQNGRLKVDPRCKHVLEMLDQYRWDTKETLTRERPVHDKYSHMADAVRYALYSYTA
jgi:phage terminase large subunit